MLRQWSMRFQCKEERWRKSLSYHLNHLNDLNSSPFDGISGDIPAMGRAYWYSGSDWNDPHLQVASHHDALQTWRAKLDKQPDSNSTTSSGWSMFDDVKTRCRHPGCIVPDIVGLVSLSKCLFQEGVDLNWGWVLRGDSAYFSRTLRVIFLQHISILPDPTRHLTLCPAFFVSSILQLSFPSPLWGLAGNSLLCLCRRSIGFWDRNAAKFLWFWCISEEWENHGLEV